jgi:ubiquinone/menaquinone biosynthesis C-methylase UbiE
VPGGLEKALADYREIAQQYDHSTRRINGVRLKAIAALRLAPGDTVLDVGCGTGFCFAAILQRIGAAGRLLAFDPSPDLLAIARERVRVAGWRNITLLEANAEQVDLAGARPSALLFSYVHDIMQSEAALRNLLPQAAPGARVAITSTRLWPASWPLAGAVNRYLWRTHEKYITNREENFERPWAKLEPWLEGLQVNVCWPGWRYVASGVLR